MSATNRGALRDPQDYYPTPEHVIKPLLSYINFEDAVCLEPCRGGGAIYRLLPDPKIYAEISEGLDYLTEPYRADICITNPPFSLAEAFAEKALSECECVVFLLRINWLGSVRRLPFWRRWPLTHLFPIAPRPSFTGTGNDSTEYAWFAWDNSGDRIKATQSITPLYCPAPKRITL